MLAKLKARLSGELGRALLRTFAARGVAAGGSLLLALVIGRAFGPAGMGVFALAQAILLGAGMLSRVGLDNALMRYVGQDQTSANVWRYCQWAFSRGLVIALAVALVLWWLRGPFEQLFNAENLASVLVGIVLAVPTFTLSFLLSGLFKAARKPATAALLENGSVALVTAGLLVAWLMLGGREDLAVIGYAYAAASLLVVGQGLWQARRWLAGQAWWKGRREELACVAGDLVPKPQFLATSRAFFVINFAGFMQQALAVMVAGWLLSSAELGLFKAAQQTAIMISFILIVINAIFPPRFAALYHEGELDALGRLARQGAALGTAMASPLLVLCLVFPGWVLNWFGEGFSEGAMLLRIIAIGQLVNVATGSVGHLLNMTGHERLMRNIALVCSSLGLASFFVLIPPLGALGAALALAFVLIVQNLVAMYFVWRRLDVWTLPGPNWLARVGVRGGGA